MIGGCALNHSLEKVRAQKCGTSVHGGCARFVTLSIYKYIVSSLSLSELLRFHSFLLRSGQAKAYFYIV